MKNIIVTGASSGLGKSLAVNFAEQGNKVIALDINKEALDKLAELYPDNIDPYIADISQSEKVIEVFNKINDKYEGIDTLVNNAGIHMNSEYVDVAYEMIDKMIDVNIKGMLYCTRAILPKMIKQQSGHIVNISSVGGLHGAPKRSLYNTAKHAMVGFGDALAQELIPQGILLVTLCPGGIATPLWNKKNNPYNGEMDSLIQPDDVFSLINYILKQPKNILFKKMVFFPTCEWHSV